MDRKLSGVSPLAYQGVRPSTPPNLVLVKRAPRITDYKEWCLGDLWLNSSSLSNKIPPKAHDLWMITSMQENIANWVHFGSGDLTYLTGDSGGAVGPDDNLNTNIISGIPNITVVGTPLNNTLTIKSDDDHSLLESLTPDTGGAVFGDNSGNINLLGTSGQITTTGTPLNNTVTLSLNDAVPLTFTEDVGIAAAQSNNLNVIGAGSVTTSGSGNTITITGADTGASSFPTDSGIAVEVGGVLNINGIHGINTSAPGATNIVDVAINNAITLGDLANISPGTASLTCQTGDILFGGDINDPTKTYRIRFPSNAGENIISFFLNSVFIGENAGNLTMTPAVALYNVGIGPFVCSNLTTGYQNVAIGNGAMEDGDTANNNVVIGYTAGQAMTSAHHNVIIGSSAADSVITGLTTGDSNVIIGSTAGRDYTGAESNNILIGANLYGIVGESNVTKISGIRGKTTNVADAIPVLIDSAHQLGTVSSSMRYKQNIEDMESSEVLNLRPVTFEYKKHPGVKQYGLIAEEVEKVMPRLVVYDDEGLPETVKYHELPAILLNEIIKLTKRVEELETKLKG